ncbi:uncharacterized protein [Triticum aestivum]|uniref:uncharacterized protein n=1 Tax=Triticum aestivum TaxID=4565 RepID=UPI001D0178E3|nr:uncharacterized protein LOC123191432 [Triticum aestivum]
MRWKQRFSQRAKASAPLKASRLRVPVPFRTCAAHHRHATRARGVEAPARPPQLATSTRRLTRAGVRGAGPAAATSTTRLAGGRGFTMDIHLVFALVCYGTAAAAATMNIPTTVNAWRARTLGGQGPHFPDPIVAAVLGNAAWFTYGWLSGSNEAMWLNVFCGFFQLVYLTTFLILCTSGALRSRGLPWRSCT